MTSDNITMFVVDDDEVSQMLVKRALTDIQSKTRVVAAVDGVEALEILRGQSATHQLCRPFIILLDLRMPRMDGFEFLHEIREDPLLQNLVVFMMSTSSQRRDIDKAYNYNVAGYLVKPDSYSPLKEMIFILDQYCHISQFSFGGCTHASPSASMMESCENLASSSC